MENKKLFSDAELLIRRYPSVVKTRKDWVCNKCGELQTKGEHIEHSHSQDMNEAIQLCLCCVDDLEKIEIKKLK